MYAGKLCTFLSSMHDSGSLHQSSTEGHSLYYQGWKYSRPRELLNRVSAVAMFVSVSCMIYMLVSPPSQTTVSDILTSPLLRVKAQCSPIVPVPLRVLMAEKY